MTPRHRAANPAPEGIRPDTTTASRIRPIRYGEWWPPKSRIIASRATAETMHAEKDEQVHHGAPLRAADGDGGRGQQRRDDDPVAEKAHGVIRDAVEIQQGEAQEDAGAEERGARGPLLQYPVGFPADVGLLLFHGVSCVSLDPGPSAYVDGRCARRDYTPPITPAAHAPPALFSGRHRMSETVSDGTPWSISTRPSTSERPGAERGLGAAGVGVGEEHRLEGAGEVLEGEELHPGPCFRRDALVRDREAAHAHAPPGVAGHVGRGDQGRAGPGAPGSSSSSGCRVTMNPKISSSIRQRSRRPYSGRRGTRWSRPPDPGNRSAPFPRPPRAASGWLARPKPARQPPEQLRPRQLEAVAGAAAHEQLEFGAAETRARQQVREIGEGAALAPGGEQAVDRRLGQPGEGHEPHADLPPAPGVVAVAAVHVGQQDAQAHPARLGDVGGRRVEAPLVGDHRGHELRRVVRLEVGDLQREQGVGGAVRLAEGVAGEALDLPPGLRGDVARRPRRRGSPR